MQFLRFHQLLLQALGLMELPHQVLISYRDIIPSMIDNLRSEELPLLIFYFGDEDPEVLFANERLLINLVEWQKL